MDTITIEDILNRWTNGEPPYPDDILVLTTFEDAKALLLGTFKDLEERLEEDNFLLVKVKRVLTKIIQRALEADYSGFSSRSETTGPFGHSYSKSSKVKQGLFLDEDDIADLEAEEIADDGGFAVINRNHGRGYHYGARYDFYNGEFYNGGDYNGYRW